MFINVTEANGDNFWSNFWIETKCVEKAEDVSKQLARIYNIRKFILLSIYVLIKKFKVSDVVDNDDFAVDDSENELVALCRLITKICDRSKIVNETGVSPLCETQLLEVKKELLAFSQIKLLDLERDVNILGDKHRKETNDSSSNNITDVEIKKLESSEIRSSSFADIQVGSCTIWWVKKQFDPEKSLSVRVGKNEKTKIKVQLRDSAYKDDGSKLSVACQDVLKGKETLNTILKKGNRKRSVQECSGSVAKKPHLNIENNSKRDDDFNEDWSMKSGILEKLKSSEVVKDMLKDSRLQKVLDEIDCSKNRRLSLQHAMDKDNEFLKFVDKCLQVIGATSTVEGEIQIDPSEVLILKKPDPEELIPKDQ